MHSGYEIADVEFIKKHGGDIKVAKFKNLATGQVEEFDFGSLIVTPPRSQRPVFEGSDLVDSNGLIDVNPYSLQHKKYSDIFAFGDATNVPTTRGLYATLNQSVVVRNNIFDMHEGHELKAVYEGYSCFYVPYAVDRHMVFKHKYDQVPCATNFIVPRLLSNVLYKMRNKFELEYMNKLFQQKENFGYPYLKKDKYFRPLNENRFAKEHNLSKDDIFSGSLHVAH